MGNEKSAIPWFLSEKTTIDFRELGYKKLAFFLFLL